MGESTSHWCLHKFCVGIVNCTEISEKNLCPLTKSNAHRIIERHKNVQGIDGMSGSLDVTKIQWENCPQA